MRMTDVDIGSIADGISRRVFMGALPLGAVLLAGCSGDDGDEGPTATVTDGGEETTSPTGTPSDPGNGGDDLTRQMETLDRGLVAVSVADGVLVRWRLLGTEPRDLGFHVYRDGERVTDAPITESTNYLDSDGEAGTEYAVRPVVDGDVGESSEAVEAWEEPYLRIPVENPGPVEHADPEQDSMMGYHANDASAADLTGDGSYDLVLKWSPNNAHDNAHDGYTNQTILDGYRLDGTHLWRIELGKNVRAGAHYTQFLVYDFDGDGTAEVACRTADGTVDGAGTVIGDPDADYRNETGRIIEGPEYFTVFDGETGEALATTDYQPARGDVEDWGDDWGNRSDRFLAGVAYLDGERPSIVNGRGYYEKTMLAAYDYRDGELTRRWIFDSDDGNQEYAGQGNHQLAVADVDDDGKDEIVYGSCVIDHDGTGLYSTGWNHGDALHVGDLVPRRDGLEVFQPHEWGPYGATLREAGTGELLWSETADADVGRGMAANVDPNYEGTELWASHGVGMWTANGEKLRDAAPPSINFGIWWTGDLQRELLDHDWHGDGIGVGKIDTWNPDAQELENLVTFEGTYSNNWTKGNPCLSGDLLGDWREEVIWREEDSNALRLYVTTHETDHRIPTLMHDPMYRLAIAWQNVAYNQPPHPSFYIGEDMDDPPRPDIDPV